MFSTVIPDKSSGFAVRARLAPIWDYSPSPRESQAAETNRTKKNIWIKELYAGNDDRKLDSISKWFSKIDFTIRTRRFGALPLNVERLGTVRNEFEKVLNEFGPQHFHANFGKKLIVYQCF